MRMFRMPLWDLEDMPVTDLIDLLEDIHLLDPKAKLEVEEGEIWDTIADEVTPFYEIVCQYKDERGQ